LDAELAVPLGYRRKRTPLVDDLSPYEEDFAARVFVAMHPDGATLEQVGAVLDVTRERIRQIEAAALRKLRATCQRMGIKLEDILRRRPAVDFDEIGYSVVVDLREAI
jgi:DNA-directed RNA polymerase sigma subunit (sigma70/sigma32)